MSIELKKTIGSFSLNSWLCRRRKIRRPRRRWSSMKNSSHKNKKRTELRSS
jgi:hypothetical protein